MSIYNKHECTVGRNCSAIQRANEVTKAEDGLAGSRRTLLHMPDERENVLR